LVNIERVGIERILEALHSNMWEGLTRIGSKSSNTKNDNYHNELIEGIFIFISFFRSFK